MLSTLIWLPVVGAALIGFWPGTISATRSRWGALAIAGSLLLWTGWLMSQFDLSNPGLQMRESFSWISHLGLNYTLGVDGLSLPLLALSNLLTLGVIFGSHAGLPNGQPLPRPRLFYTLILLVNAGMAGALVAQNLLLFILFYEVELIPFYLLIVIWGGSKAGIRCHQVFDLHSGFWDVSSGGVSGIGLVKWHL
ncbi:hypothetical protein [Neosynechococcus sphagnicola]|uniref:hypothetical protein n=1 Tax=Neosynechococcus sphagnicola TaxID=1501145 RepID=UPI000B0B8BB2